VITTLFISYAMNNYISKGNNRIPFFEFEQKLHFGHKQGRLLLLYSKLRYLLFHRRLQIVIENNNLLHQETLYFFNAMYYTEYFFFKVVCVFFNTYTICKLNKV